MVSRQARMASVCMAALLVVGSVHAEKSESGRTIGTHANGIASVHYSPDGKLLATGGGDKMIRVWDVAKAKAIYKWKGPNSFTCAVRFSPDGRTLVAAGYETGPGNAIYRYDVVNGKELPKLPGHETGGVRRLEFTPDGKQLVTGGFDGTLRVWDLATSKQVRQMKVEGGTVYSLALSPDGKVAVTAGRDGLKVWDLQAGKELPREEMNKHSCVTVAVAPDGIVASGDSNSVKFWELATGKLVQSLDGFKGELSQLIFSSDGRTLYTGSYDRMIRLWEVRTRRLVHEVEAHTGWVWGIAVSRDEKFLASCSVDTKLIHWDLADLGRPSKKSAALGTKDLEKLLTELGSNDAGVGYRAVCALASDPRNSLPELKKRLMAAQGREHSTSDIARLIRELDSDRYKVREQAFEALARAGAAALPALQQAVKNPPSIEVRKRAQRLLSRLDPTSLPVEELIALRGVQALEYIGNGEARKVLEQLSKGQGSPRLSAEASQALQRLTRMTVQR